MAFDDPPAGVTIEFGPEAFEHRFSRFFDLKEQRSAIALVNRPIAQNVPTLPTPTALKAMSLSEYRSNRQSRSGGRRFW